MPPRWIIAPSKATRHASNAQGYVSSPIPHQATSGSIKSLASKREVKPTRVMSKLEGDVMDLQRPRPCASGVQALLQVMPRCLHRKCPPSSMHKSYGVLCPVYGIPAHACGIMTSLLKTKPICPLSKVFKDARATIWGVWVTGWLTSLHHTCQSCWNVPAI
jgi:hypothetical protein